jgi:deoxyribodipyrimidine photo-lyase
MDSAIVMFTRDLRLHDNPALHLACGRARQVIPLFVADPRIAAPPNRQRFLAQSLADLRENLRALGGDLVIRRGNPAAEVIRLAGQAGATAVFVADDVSRYAVRRRRALQRECARHRLELTVTPGVTVVPPGQLAPAGGGRYRMFTPYWRAWRAVTWRRPCPPPAAIRMPEIGTCGGIPPSGPGWSPGLTPGGERAARERFARWRDGGLERYGSARDGLAAGGTSRLGAYLRFGCLSPLEAALGALGRPGGEEFCRQLAWRDFFHQIAGVGEAAGGDRPPGRSWRRDPDALEAWRHGRTGIPIVDAGMRQLAAEGFMPNRARMITASFLTRTLGIDWREGYCHFGALLADGDVPCNMGNWRWVAGIAGNPRPGRPLSPLRQARRFDPAGEYVRRWLPELAALGPAHIRRPWRPGGQSGRGPAPNDRYEQA